MVRDAAFEQLETASNWNTHQFYDFTEEKTDSVFLTYECIHPLSQEP